MSDPSVCSYNAIALNSLIWHLLVWPQTRFLTFAHCISALTCRENGLDAEEQGSKSNPNKAITSLPRHSHKLISDDQDLVKDSRSDISFRITSYVNRSPAVRQSGANFSNLISITTQDIHGPTRHFQSSIKILCFSSQSCRQIATDIHEMI